MSSTDMPVPICNNMNVLQTRAERKNNESMFSFSCATLKFLLFRAFHMKKSHTNIHNMNSAMTCNFKLAKKMLLSVPVSITTMSNTGYKMLQMALKVSVVPAC